MRFYQDDDRLTLVRWFACEPDAKGLGFYTRFASGFWSQQYLKEWAGVGQIGMPVSWGRDVDPTTLPGKKPFGTPEQFEHGVFFKDRHASKLGHPDCLPFPVHHGGGQDYDSGAGAECKAQYQELCLEGSPCVPEFFCCTTRGWDGHRNFNFTDFNKPFTIDMRVSTGCQGEFQVTDGLSRVDLSIRECVWMSLIGDPSGELAVWRCFDSFDLQRGPIVLHLWQQNYADISIPHTITLIPNRVCSEDGSEDVAPCGGLVGGLGMGHDYDDGDSLVPAYGSGHDYDAGHGGAPISGSGHDYDDGHGTGVVAGRGSGHDYDSGAGAGPPGAAGSGHDYDSGTGSGAPDAPPGSGSGQDTEFPCGAAGAGFGAGQDTEDGGAS